MKRSSPHSTVVELVKRSHVDGGTETIILEVDMSVEILLVSRRLLEIRINITYFRNRNLSRLVRHPGTVTLLGEWFLNVITPIVPSYFSVAISLLGYTYSNSPNFTVV